MPVTLRESAEREVEKTAEDAVEDDSLRAAALGRIAESKSKKDRGGLHPLLLVAQPAAQAFDAFSTRKAMAAGGREGNSFVEPFADNPAALYAAKVGTGALVAFLADRLARSGHRTAGKILSGLDIALPVGAGIHNMQMAGRSTSSVPGGK